MDFHFIKKINHSCFITLYAFKVKFKNRRLKNILKCSFNEIKANIFTNTQIREN